MDVHAARLNAGLCLSLLVVLDVRSCLLHGPLATSKSSFHRMMFNHPCPPVLPTVAPPEVKSMLCHDLKEASSPFRLIQATSATEAIV